MSRTDLEKFLYLFDKEPERQTALKEGREEAFEGLQLNSQEKEVLQKQDVATLYEWGLHPLLVRNFSGTLKIRYVDEYKKRGLV